MYVVTAYFLVDAQSVIKKSSAGDSATSFSIIFCLESSSLIRNDCVLVYSNGTNHVDRSLSSVQLFFSETRAFGGKNYVLAYFLGVAACMTGFILIFFIIGYFAKVAESENPKKMIEQKLSQKKSIVRNLSLLQSDSKEVRNWCRMSDVSESQNSGDFVVIFLYFFVIFFFSID